MRLGTCKSLNHFKKGMAKYWIYNFLFLLRFQETVCRCLRFCDETEQIHQFAEYGSAIHITNLEYPKPYETSKDCAISIQLDFDSPVGLHIEHMGEQCYTPYRFSNGNTDEALDSYMYQNCDNISKNFRVTTDSFFKQNNGASLEILLQQGDGDGFNLTVAAYPLKHLNSSSSLYLPDTHSAYIASHQTFPENSYPHAVTYKLILRRIPSGSSVVIKFLIMSLGAADDCLTGDAARNFVRVLDDSEKVIYECGDTTYEYPSYNLPEVVASSTNNLTIEFKTDEMDQYKGFLLRYSAIAAGSSQNPSSTKRPATSPPGVPTTVTFPSTTTTGSTLPPATNAGNSSAQKTMTIAIGAGAGVGGLMLVFIIVVLAWVLHLKLRTHKTQAKSSELAIVNQMSEISEPRTVLGTAQERVPVENVCHTIEDTDDCLSYQLVENDDRVVVRRKQEETTGEANVKQEEISRWLQLRCRQMKTSTIVWKVVT